MSGQAFYQCVSCPNCLGSIAKLVAAERYGPQKKVQKDMLGSFVAHGLTQTEAESEILLQMYACFQFMSVEMVSFTNSLVTVLLALIQLLRQSAPPSYTLSPIPEYSPDCAKKLRPSILIARSYQMMMPAKWNISRPSSKRGFASFRPWPASCPNRLPRKEITGKASSYLAAPELARAHGAFSAARTSGAKIPTSFAPSVG